MEDNKQLSSERSDKIRIYYFILAFVIIGVSVIGCVVFRSDDLNYHSIVVENVNNSADKDQVLYLGDIIDSTDGKEIRGITVPQEIGGYVEATYKNGLYYLVATIKQLPDPQAGDYYEGWIVNETTNEWISAGPAVKTNELYVVIMDGPTDYTDSHNKFVLTIEQDDGNSEAGDKILESSIGAIRE